MQKSTEDQISALQSARALKRTFSSLVDAMKSAQRKEQLEEKILEIQETSRRSLASLEGLNKRITELIRSLAPSVEQQLVTELENQIVSFSMLAVDQTKAKLNEKIKAELDMQQSDLSSERTKTFKSIEAFIATKPFPIRDKTTKVRFVDGAYEARGSYNCTEEIQYEVTFDTKKSRLLGRELKLSMFDRDIKVPVSLGKSWLRKEQVPDYERIDQYFLESAESAENSLILIFRHTEKDAKLKMIYSKINHHSSLSVEYADTQKSVEITSTPGLNKFLDSEPLERAMERIWLSINEVENEMSGLAKLSSDGKDVLEKLDCFPFFAKSWKMLSPKIAAEIKSNREGPNSEEKLSEAYVRDKLAPLGKEAAIMIETLGIAQA